MERKNISKKSTPRSGETIVANVQRQKGSIQTDVWSMWINLSWLHLKDEVEINKEDIVFDMKDLFIKKDIENEEIMREKKEKCSQQYESELWNTPPKK